MATVDQLYTKYINHHKKLMDLQQDIRTLERSGYSNAAAFNELLVLRSEWQKEDIRLNRDYEAAKANNDFTPILSKYAQRFQEKGIVP